MPRQVDPGALEPPVRDVAVQPHRHTPGIFAAYVQYPRSLDPLAHRMPIETLVCVLSQRRLVPAG